MCALLQSLHVIARSHFKNQTAEDNLDVLRVIPLFLNYVSLNSCLQRISRMNFLTQLLSPVPSFSPPLALSSFAQTLITELHLPQNNTTVPRVSHPCPGNHSVGVLVWHCFGGGGGGGDGGGDGGSGGGVVLRQS